ncbi:MAG TPA: glycosyltransferase [Azospirillaceae bacterium]|nr:glycosyltransferase [Azospirillaceae bacterium]
MKLAVFGLAVSSSWGNGHATLWRGLIRAMARRGHRVVFFERDQPWYADTRDTTELPGGTLVLYRDWEEVRARAGRELADADCAMVTSFCPDGVAATRLMGDANVPVRAFYDLDTPVTLAKLAAGETLPWIGPEGLGLFDLVLSYTGGAALDALRDRLGARDPVPLYGWADPEVHRPVPAVERFRADLSYLGTYAADRQAGVEALFVEPARRRPGRRFTLAGAMYPADFPWTDNIWFVRHLPPEEHAAFLSSSRLTLNVTREAMAAMGWCPSGRLFEAAAAGVPVVSDVWEGLDTFFRFGTEILPARTTADVLHALELSGAELSRIAAAAQARTLAEHTADRRAAVLEGMVEAAWPGVPRKASARNEGALGVVQAAQTLSLQAKAG